MALEIKIIAVCEDDELSLRGIKDIFQDNGIYALYYSGPIKLLEAIQEGISIAVLDHNYDGIKYTGLTLTKRIKEMFPECSIIIISTTRNPTVIADYANSGLIVKILNKLDIDFKVQLVFEVRRLLALHEPKEAEPPKKKNRIKQVFFIIIDFFIKHFVTK